MSLPPPCRVVMVFAFRGDRSSSFATRFLSLLDDEKNQRGPGPSRTDCLLYAGHTGVSVDGGTTILGFNPDPIDPQGNSVPTWIMMNALKNGDAFPGIVHIDSATFAAAHARGLMMRRFRVILPDPAFHDFSALLDSETKQSKYSYGFPNGDGDCNCTTWLERLGLPLLSGRMNEFMALPNLHPSRRFGRCI